MHDLPLSTLLFGLSLSSAIVKLSLLMLGACLLKLAVMSICLNAAMVVSTVSSVVAAMLSGHSRVGIRSLVGRLVYHGGWAYHHVLFTVVEPLSLLASFDLQCMAGGLRDSLFGTPFNLATWGFPTNRDPCKRVLIQPDIIYGEIRNQLSILLSSFTRSQSYPEAAKAFP